MATKSQEKLAKSFGQQPKKKEKTKVPFKLPGQQDTQQQGQLPNTQGEGIAGPQGMRFPPLPPGLTPEQQMAFLQQMINPQEGQIRPMGTTKGIVRRTMSGELDNGPKGLDYLDAFSPTGSAKGRAEQVAGRQAALDQTSFSQNPAIAAKGAQAVQDLFKSQIGSGIRNPDGTEVPTSGATQFDNGSRVMGGQYGKGFSLPQAQPGGMQKQVQEPLYGRTNQEQGDFSGQFNQAFQGVANQGYQQQGQVPMMAQQPMMGPPAPQQVPQQQAGFQLPQMPQQQQSQQLMGPPAPVQSQPMQQASTPQQGQQSPARKPNAGFAPYRDIPFFANGLHDSLKPRDETGQPINTPYTPARPEQYQPAQPTDEFGYPVEVPLDPATAAAFNLNARDDVRKQLASWKQPLAGQTFQGQPQQQQPAFHPPSNGFFDLAQLEMNHTPASPGAINQPNTYGLPLPPPQGPPPTMQAAPTLGGPQGFVNNTLPQLNEPIPEWGMGMPGSINVPNTYGLPLPSSSLGEGTPYSSQPQPFYKPFPGYSPSAVGQNSLNPQQPMQSLLQQIMAALPTRHY